MDDKFIQGDEGSEDLTVPELVSVDDDSVEILEPEVEQAAHKAESGPTGVIELPEDPAEAVPVLLSALGQAQAENNALLETVQRVAAEFDNFRKRSARERDEIVTRASQRVIERLLPTLDSFDAALMYEAQTEAEENMISGMRDTHRLLMDALAVDGFAAIEASGVPFDPSVHEAVTGPGGDGDGELMVNEMRRGYTLHSRVIRAALVAVEHA